jgi:MoaA/NifB/PqqE/SkfB family radical SAM enzyme
MKHWLINPTWRCQNHCDYCWMQQSVGVRADLVAAHERPMWDWANAIQRDEIDLVDIAGGEPLLVPWIADLLAACPQTLFGISTNALSGPGVSALAKAKPQNLVAVNVSYHPRTMARDRGYQDRYTAALNEMREAGLKVHVNIVDAPGVVDEAEAMIARLREAGVHVSVNPEEHVTDLLCERDAGLECMGGVDHMTVAPDGSAWACLSALRSPRWRELCLGNWLDRTVDLRRKPVPCYLNCVDYYVLKESHSCGDMWGVKPHVVALKGASE